MNSTNFYPKHAQSFSLETATIILRTFSFAIIGWMVILILPFEAYAITPIAHTDVVPYQRIEYGSSFNFGVVAFSKPGIDRVDFAISGQGYSGGTKSSSTMALNTRVASTEYSGVWEYYTTISASEFSSNGAITVTPTVYDNDGNSRALDSVTMIVEGASADFDQFKAWVDIGSSDGTGTVGDSEDPFPSIQSAVTATQAANGGSSSGNVIYLVEGTYSISGLSGTTNGEWLTITKASGADRNNVIINEGTPGVSRLKIDNITLQSLGSEQEILRSVCGSAHYWTNSCRRIGCGRTTDRSNPVYVTMIESSATGAYYSTDDYTYNVAQAYDCCQLVRGAVVETVMKDVFHDYLCVINAKVSDVTNEGTNYHTDVLQVYQVSSNYRPVENRLAYNIYATDCHYQGIMREDTSSADGGGNNAFINVFIEMRDPGEDGGGGYRQLYNYLSKDAEDHLLVWHCSFPYAHASLCKSSMTNSSIVGNLFWQEISNTTPDSSTDWLYNHFIGVYGVTPSCTGTTCGTDNDWPCPHWYAREIDTGAGTSSHGDGAIDISTPGASDFGYPSTGSPLMNALPFAHVPCDALGIPRDSRPDIGALEVYSLIDMDGDGVGDTIENGAPNNGDGNNDGIADRTQTNVTSFMTFDESDYVTLESPEGTSLTGVWATDNPSPEEVPAEISFPYGTFEFIIKNVGAGENIELTAYLPDEARPLSYYKYGMTPDSDTDHWYEFMYDGTTGAEIDGNIITLHFVDAQKGDDVLTEDSQVIDIGGPVTIDLDGDGYSTEDGDLDDSDDTIYPGATEICGDGIDQDCDGLDLECEADDSDESGTSSGDSSGCFITNMF